MKKLLMLAAAVSATAVFAKERFVDKTGANDAYTTIQAAIDAASDGDVITVAPGVYDEGETVDADVGRCRVFVNKRVTIRAQSDDPADTHIVGASDPDAAAADLGAGPKAVRCVYFTAYAAMPNTSGSVLRGFTIRGGRPGTKSTSPEPLGNAGGVLTANEQRMNAWVTDCVISNCVGVRGGAVRYGNYVRCRILENSTLSGNSCGRDANFINCLILRNASGNQVMNGRLVNCTIGDTSDSDEAIQPTRAVTLYNSVLVSTKFVAGGETATSVAKGSVLGAPLAPSKDAGCAYDEPYPVFAPAFGDYRPRAGSKTVGLGDASYIATVFPSVPEGVDIYRSLDGVDLPATGAVTAGCFQKPVAAEGGTIQFLRSGTGSGVLPFGGYASRFPAAYACCEKPYAPLKIAPVPDAGSYFYCIDVTRVQGEFPRLRRYPDMDETFTVLTPPAGVVATNSIRFTNQALWVNPDPKIGSDGNDGTEAHPFLTIKKALSGIQRTTETMVLAAEGNYTNDYAQSTISGDGLKTRLLVYDRYVRIKGAGRGKSVVSGEADPESAKYAGDGRGPNAMRCLTIHSSHACVQGFTFKDGYASWSEGERGSMSEYGGLVSSLEPNEDGKPVYGCHQILDCDLDGGVSYRAGVSYKGMFVRCQSTNCTAMSGGGFRESNLKQCLVYGCKTASTSMTIGGSDCRFWNCTFVSDPGGMPTASDIAATNCILIGGGTQGITWTSKGLGNVCWNYSTVTKGSGAVPGVTYLETDPYLADPANGDFRMTTCSEAFGAVQLIPEYWYGYVCDFNGNPPYVTADGKTNPGAVQPGAPGIYVDAAANGESSVVGLKRLEPGETVTVTHTDANRHCVGYVVNGEEVLSSPVSWSWTAPAKGPWTEGYRLTPIISTNWYVNADRTIGSDDNSGFDPQHPWLTLAKLQQMKDSFLEGDVVHAARGDYDANAVTTTVTVSYKAAYDPLPSRVEVPAGVTLVADEGPEVTFITGASGSGTYGMGPGAIRCASLCSKSRLERFTLRGGRTLNQVNDGDQFCGGGVFAGQPVTSLGLADCGVAYGCVITNCVGQRGGGARYGRIVNCRILDCGATACAAAGSQSWFLGCYINGCQINDQIMRDSFFVGSCTFGPTQASNGSRAVSEVTPGYGGVVNCVFMNKIGALRAGAAGHYRGCKFLRMDASVNRTSLGAGCEEFDSIEVMGLDAEGHPIDKNSVVVDSSVDALLPAATNCFANADLAGVQRIFNGEMDAGCYEYDWRGDYSADIGAKVSKAGPQVVESGSNVLIRDGSVAYAFTCGIGTRNTTYKLPFEVTGTGTLTATLNGEDIGSWTHDDGPVEYVFKNKDVANALVFNYLPGANDAGGGLLGRTETITKGMLLIVR